MFLNILQKIPYLQSIFYFPMSAHRTTLPKFLVLWFLSSLPVVLAIFLSPMPDDSISVFGAIAAKIKESLSVSELFVYVASYLTPILYIVYEKYKLSESRNINRVVDSFKGLFKGYGLVAFTSLVLIILTSAAFSMIKGGSATFHNSVLNFILVKGSLVVYLYSLYCWYLALLDGGGEDGYRESVQQSETALMAGLGSRIRGRTR